MRQRAALEERLECGIRRLLGCGTFGWVFQCDRPWVLKLTRDELEGPAWADLRELQREDPAGYPAILRVRDVLQLTPGLFSPLKGEAPIYAVLREEAMPLTRVAGREDQLAPDLRHAVQCLARYSAESCGAEGPALGALQDISQREAHDINTTLVNLVLRHAIAIGDLRFENLGLRVHSSLPGPGRGASCALDIGQLVPLEVGRTRTGLARRPIERFVRSNAGCPG